MHPNDQETSFTFSVSSGNSLCSMLSIAYYACTEVFMCEHKFWCVHVLDGIRSPQTSELRDTKYEQSITRMRRPLCFYLDKHFDC